MAAFDDTPISLFGIKSISLLLLTAGVLVPGGLQDVLGLGGRFREWSVFTAYSVTLLTVTAILCFHIIEQGEGVGSGYRRFWVSAEFEFVPLALLFWYRAALRPLRLALPFVIARVARLNLSVFLCAATNANGVLQFLGVQGAMGDLLKEATRLAQAGGKLSGTAFFPLAVLFVTDSMEGSGAAINCRHQLKTCIRNGKRRRPGMTAPCPTPHKRGREGAIWVQGTGLPPESGLIRMGAAHLEIARRYSRVPG
ncbi:MAG: hypothetical protein AAGH17_03170 [Pseudomonadota bacterium]